jgi:hypothetical protein
MFIGIAATTCGTAYGQDNPGSMRFDARPPQEPVELFGNAWTIYASGEIDEGAAPRLDALIAARNIPPHSMLILDSPGGNLLSGLQLGRTIRIAGLVTYVGRPDRDARSHLPGGCYSACSLAFLGGVSRFVDPASIYGMHRFYFSTDSPLAADTAQVLSSEIVQYLREMGVDPGLFSLMTMGGKSDVVVPSRQQLEHLRVVTSGSNEPVWTVESLPQGLYLKGEQSTEWGPEKIIFFCAGPRMVNIGAFFSSRGRGEAVLQQLADGLLLDGKVLHIPPERVQGPTVDQGDVVNVLFILTTRELRALKSAHTVGVSLQFAYDAPVFSGIGSMDFRQGSAKLTGFLTSCR